MCTIHLIIKEVFKDAQAEEKEYSVLLDSKGPMLMI